MANSDSPSTSDFFYKLPKSRQHIIALAILFIIPFILFFETTLGGKELQRHDITQWRAGSEAAFEYRAEYGEEALWLNNMYLGMPAYVVSVNTVVPHLNFLAKYFKSIYPAFQFWTILAGMYVLLILMGFRTLSALIGAIGFGLTTYFPIIIGAGHTSKFVALGYAPWIFAGYWMLTRTSKKILGLFFFCVAMALEVKAGHPQITYYFMYLLGALWIYDSWEYLKVKKDLKEWGIVTTFLVIGGVIGILAHAQSFLTLLEYSPHSIRGGSALANTTGLSEGYAFLWSQGIKETLTLFMPDLYGGASPTYFGSKPGTAGPHYLGALMLPFILIALFKERSKIMYLFFGVGSLAILFSWGGNFLLLNQLAFDYIPYFNKFRAPETWLVVTSFCYVIVAVFGIRWLFDYVLEKNVSPKRLYLPLGITLGVFLFLFIQVKTMDFVRPGEVENIAQQIAQQNQVSPQNPQALQQASNYVQTRIVPDRSAASNRDVLRLGILLVLSAGVIYLLLNKKISLGTGGLLLVAVVSFDMISVGKRYISENVIVAGNIDPVRYIESQKRDIDQYIVDQNSKTNTYPYRTFPLLNDVFQDAIPSYYYPTIGGYTGAKLSILQDITTNSGPLFKSSTGLNLELLGALNVKYITYNFGLQVPDLEMVFSGNSGAVYENKKILPKAFFVDSVIVANSPQEAYDFVDRPGVDYSELAVVETDKEIISKPDSTTEVKVAFYSGQDLEIHIKRSEPGFLVLSEVYYPEGWVNTLNGKPIDMHKTNYVLRGFEIPAGEHVLKLSFEPQSYYLGVTLSWVSLGIQILLGLFAAYSYWSQKKNSE